MKVVDADRRVLGRMASEIAKQALLGEDVVVVNAEKAYVSGDAKSIYRDRRALFSIKNKGNMTKGPFHYKRPDKYVRKVIRGMLPYKTERGRKAFERVKVYIGVPEAELKKRDIPLPKPGRPKKKLRRKVTVASICKHLGGSW